MLNTHTHTQAHLGDRSFWRPSNNAIIEWKRGKMTNEWNERETLYFVYIWWIRQVMCLVLLVGCLVDFCPMVPADKNDPECVKCGEMLFKVKEDLFFFFFFFIFFHHDHHLHVWLCKRVPHLGTLPFILVPNDGHHTYTHTHFTFFIYVRFLFYYYYIGRPIYSFLSFSSYVYLWFALFAMFAMSVCQFIAFNVI